ncbi:MAG: hypothetical protein Q9196_007023, partial [Gyalolechia fulgens]
LSLEQRQLFQSVIESNRQLVHANERMTHELQQMRCAVQLQLEVPPQVPLQKPITLLDACGKVSAFHLDFINCSEAFLAVLKIRFQQYGVEERGIQMLDDSKFVLEDYRGKLDLSRPWSKVLRPSQKIDMSMVFRRDMPSSTCPRMEDEISDFKPIKKAERDTTMDGLPADRREGMDGEERSDLIDQFRRVQLVCPSQKRRLKIQREAASLIAFMEKYNLPRPGTQASAIVIEFLRNNNLPDLAIREFLRNNNLLDIAIRASEEPLNSASQSVADVETEEIELGDGATSIEKSQPGQPTLDALSSDSNDDQEMIVTRESAKHALQSTSDVPPNSRFHLFDMSAALLTNIEKNHRNTSVRENGFSN